ncbi:MAG: DUF3822 family protein [Adhaeribacter sp.]
MTSETKHYRQDTRIMDESFLVQDLGKYHLYLAVGRQVFRAAVMDAERNKFIVLEDYELSQVHTPLQVAQQVQEILKTHEYLGLPGWKKIRVAVKNQSFTLVPETLFEPQAVADYLRLNCTLDLYHEQVLTYRHRAIEAVNIFAADKYLLRALEETYPGKTLSYVHQTSALIAALQHYGERNGKMKLYAFVEKNSLTILILRDGALLFCNMFHFNTPEDFMYFLVFVMQEQKLNPDQDAVTIWGDITHDSALFTLMRKYIRHVRFGARLAGVAFSYKLQEQFEHRFLDVYSLHFA